MVRGPRGHALGPEAGWERERAGPGGSLVRQGFLFVLCAVAIRAGFFALDAHPRFFLGDSETYLWTSLPIAVPMDRSWTYGETINRFLVFSHSLRALLLLQGFVSALLCAGTALLCRWLGVRSVLCWAILLLMSVDPLLLYWDRAVMTDSPGAALTWGGLAAVVVALVTRRAALAAIAAVSLTLAVTLRTAVLPVVLWVPVVAFVTAALDGGRGPGTRTPTEVGLPRRLLAPVVLGICLVAGVVWYARTTGRLTHAPPSPNPRSGYFLIGVVAPILAPTDFRGLGVRDPARLLAETRAADRSIRTVQIYLEGGVALRLEAELGDWRKVSSAGRVLARRAILRDPLGFARLCLLNLRDFTSVRSQRRWFDGSFGLDRPLTQFAIGRVREMTSEHLTPDVVSRPSLVLSWTRWNVPTMVAQVWACLLLPGIAFGFWRRLTRARRMAVVVLGGSAWVYLATLVAFSTDAPSRYVLPMIPVIFVLLGIIVEAALDPTPRELRKVPSK